MRKYQAQYDEWKRNPPLCACGCKRRVATDILYAAFQSVCSQNGRGPIFLLGHQTARAEQARSQKAGSQKAGSGNHLLFQSIPLPECCKPKEGPGNRFTACIHDRAALDHALSKCWAAFNCEGCTPVYGRGYSLGMQSGIDTELIHQF